MAVKRLDVDEGEETLADRILGEIPTGPNLTRFEEPAPQIPTTVGTPVPTIAFEGLLNEMKNGLLDAAQNLPGRKIFAGLVMAAMGTLIVNDTKNKSLINTDLEPAPVSEGSPVAGPELSTIDPQETRNNILKHLVIQRFTLSEADFLMALSDFEATGITLEEVDREAGVQQQTMREAITDFSRRSRDQALELLHRGRVFGKHFPEELRDQLMHRLEQLGFGELTEAERAMLEQAAETGVWVIQEVVVELTKDRVGRVLDSIETKEAAIAWLDSADIFHPAFDKKLRIFILDGLENRGIILSPKEKRELAQLAAQRVSAKIKNAHGDFAEAALGLVQPAEDTINGRLKSLNSFKKTFSKSAKVRAAALKKMKRVVSQMVEAQFIPTALELLAEGLQKDGFELTASEQVNLLKADPALEVDAKTKGALDALGFTTLDQVIELIEKSFVFRDRAFDITRFLLLDELEQLGFQLPEASMCVGYVGYEVSEPKMETKALQLTDEERQRLHDWFASTSRFDVIDKLYQKGVTRHDIAYEIDQPKTWLLIVRALKRFGIEFNPLEKELFETIELYSIAAAEHNKHLGDIADEAKAKHLETLAKTKGKNKRKKGLSPEVQESLLAALEADFNRFPEHHPGISWTDVRTKLEANPEALWTLNEMQRVGAHPQVVGYDQKTDRYLFCETFGMPPNERCSFFYDKNAEELFGKKYKNIRRNKTFQFAELKGNVMDKVEGIGAELFSLDDFQRLSDKHIHIYHSGGFWFQTGSAEQPLGIYQNTKEAVDLYSHQQFADIDFEKVSIDLLHPYFHCKIWV